MLNSSKYANKVKIPALEDLGIDVSRVLRVIESLKVNNREIHPGAVALELGIPRSYIYENLDLLELVYSNMEKAFGHDKLIFELLKNKNRLENKIKKLEKNILQKDAEAKKNFNDGFSQGASLNYEKKASQNDLSFAKDIWARSIMHLELDQELDVTVLKKKYRNLVSLLHPDVTNENTNEMMNKVQEAYNYLLSIYS